MRKSTKPMRLLALAALAATLAGCSEYLDRRETISLNGGNALAANQVTMMVDPWPRDSANKNIAFNGNVMESAMARYRTGKVIPPRGTGTSATYSNSSSAAPAADPGNGAAPVGPTVTQVK
jgi:hypothetical protein